MPDSKIRPLNPADLERISDIDETVGLHRKPFFQKYLNQISANPEDFIACGVEKKGALQGFVFARVRVGDFGARKTIAVLDSMGVSNQYKGKGLGSMLVEEVERQMRERNIAVLRTVTLWTDPVMTGFFSSAGFKLDASHIVEKDLTQPFLDSSEEPPARDRVLVRSFRKEDIPGIVRIDAKYTAGGDRYAYFAAKGREMLEESGIRVSVVSEDDGAVTGFIMARVDVGEFGRVETQAVIDSLAIHPAYAGTGVGHALLSQLLMNLSSLRVESVRTLISWENFKLLRFLIRYGFVPSQRLVLAKELQ